MELLGDCLGEILGACSPVSDSRFRAFSGILTRPSSEVSDEPEDEGERSGAGSRVRVNEGLRMPFFRSVVGCSRGEVCERKNVATRCGMVSEGGGATSKAGQGCVLGRRSQE